jgi:regulator of nucleoside diphosphate kinase
MTTSHLMETTAFELGLPPIAMTIADRERLERLANASMARFPQTAEYLAREVERAQILDLGHDGPQFVRMGAWVEFRDDRTGQVRRVSLAYPHQADISAGKVSVLTPIGAALIGLSEGQSIEWQAPAGDKRSLTVLRIGNEDGHEAG